MVPAIPRPVRQAAETTAIPASARRRIRYLADAPDGAAAPYSLGLSPCV